MKWRVFFAFLIYIWLSIELWIGFDWILNYSIYHGMEPLWLYQIPFTNITVYMSPWQLYYISKLEAIFILPAILTYVMYKCLEK